MGKAASYEANSKAYWATCIARLTLCHDVALWNCRILSGNMVTGAALDLVCWAHGLTEHLHS